MKKLVAILLAAAMLLSLAACGGTAAEAASDDTDAETASAGTSSETPPKKPDGFGSSGEVTQGASANTISEDTTVTSTTYTSIGDDENALRVCGDGHAVLHYGR